MKLKDLESIGHEKETYVVFVGNPDVDVHAVLRLQKARTGVQAPVNVTPGGCHV